MFRGAPFPWRWKREWCQPTHCPLHWNPSWLRDVHTHGRTLGYTKYRLRTRQSKMIGQRKLRRNAPYKWFKLPWTWDSLSEPAYVCLFTSTLFHPDKHFTCFTAFCFFVGIHVYKADGPGALSLATSLVARIQCSYCRGLTSISDREPKSCFKLLQAEVTRDHFYRI